MVVIVVVIIVTFVSVRFWEYDSARKLKDSGQITRYGLPSALEDMDAVFTWAKNRKTYFFKDEQYWRYNEDTRRTDPGYPRRIRSAWGFPDYINAAVKWLNSRTYVFRGRQYLKLQKGKVHVERAYPKVIADKWMKCNSKGRGILDSEEPWDLPAKLSKLSLMMSFTFLLVQPWRYKDSSKIP